MPPLQRKAIAAVALAALLLLGIPSAVHAGGTDEPGYTGGCSSSMESHAEGTGSGGDSILTGSPDPRTGDDIASLGSKQSPAPATQDGTLIWISRVILEGILLLSF